MRVRRVSLLAFVACSLFSVAPAPAQDPVGTLRTLLTGNDYSPEAVDAAVKAAVDAAAVDAVPVLLDGLDRFSEKLTKSEADAARSVAELEEKKGDDAVAADKRAAIEKAQSSGSSQQKVLDGIAAGLPKLLDAIAAKAQPASVPPLVDTYEKQSRHVDELERKDEEQKGKLAQLSSKLFTLESDADKDSDARRELSRVTSDKIEMQAKVDRTAVSLDLHRTARAKIVDVIGALLRGAKGPEVDAALRQVEKRIDGKAPAAERIVWIDLYARLGRETIPAELEDAAQRAAKEAKRHEDELAKLRDKYEKAKEAYYKSIDLKTNTVSTATQNAFNALQKQVQDEALAQREMEDLRGTAARAVGPAIATLPDDKRAKATTALLASTKSEKNLEVRVGLLESCGALDDAAVREALRKLLVDDKEVKARLAALEALVVLKDADAIEIARARLLVHENWRVRSAAVSAMLRVPQKESIAALIRALSVEGGRVKEDVTDALQQLTGQKLGMSAPVWQKWWDEHGASFRPEELKPPRARVVAAWDQPKTEGNVTFYGIRSISKRMCFVLDVSLSMRDPASENSEKRKIDVAKEQLKAAITAMADDDQFVIVVFAESVARWQPKLATATQANKAKVLKWIDDTLDMGPGTNIHAGMKDAFTIAGLGTRDAGYESQIDTIFFLSDGDASVGEVTDPLELRREIREWNRLSRIRIHTIGVGESPNVALLYGIAEDAGGQFQKR